MIVEQPRLMFPHHSPLDFFHSSAPFHSFIFPHLSIIQSVLPLAEFPLRIHFTFFREFCNFITFSSLRKTKLFSNVFILLKKKNQLQNRSWKLPVYSTSKCNGNSVFFFKLMFIKKFFISFIHFFAEITRFLSLRVSSLQPKCTDDLNDMELRKKFLLLLLFSPRFIK